MPALHSYTMLCTLIDHHHHMYIPTLEYSTSSCLSTSTNDDESQVVLMVRGVHMPIIEECVCVGDGVARTSSSL